VPSGTAPFWPGSDQSGTPESSPSQISNLSIINVAQAGTTAPECHHRVLARLRR
jgi:hypothetical protein